jgi:hypothetical protein
MENSGYQFDAVQNGDAMKVYPVLCNDIIAVTDKGMMLLQNRVDSQKDVPGSHSEAHGSSSLGDDQAVNIKVEEVSDMEDGEDPVPMTVVGIKAEHVSCMPPLCHCDACLSHIQNCLFFFSYSSFTQNSSLVNREIFINPL